MFASTLVFGLVSALAASAQSVSGAPFGNSSITSTGTGVAAPVTATVVGPTSYTSGSALPSGVSAIFTLSTSFGGAFLCGVETINFAAGVSASSGTQFSLLVNGSITCNGNLLFVATEISGQFAKRQTAAQALIVGVTGATTNPAAFPTYFTSVFSIAGTTLNLNNGGVAYAFGLQNVGTNVVLVAYNPALGVPAGVTPVSLVANVIATAAAPTTTPTGTAGVGAVATSTSTVTVLQGGVIVNVNIVISITILATPLVSNQVVCVNVNGAAYCVTQAVTVTAITSTLSSNGVALPTGGIVYVSVCPVVVAATQVVTNNGVATTLVGTITTTGVVTATQGSGAVVSTITVAGASITAKSGITVTSGAAVVSATAKSTGLPVVSQVGAGSKTAVPVFLALVMGALFL